MFRISLECLTRGQSGKLCCEPAVPSGACSGIDEQMVACGRQCECLVNRRGDLLEERGGGIDPSVEPDGIVHQVCACHI